jgi:hypothetical protein
MYVLLYIISVILFNKNKNLFKINVILFFIYNYQVWIHQVC